MDIDILKKKIDKVKKDMANIDGQLVQLKEEKGKVMEKLKKEKITTSEELKVAIDKLHTNIDESLKSLTEKLSII